MQVDNLTLDTCTFTDNSRIFDFNKITRFDATNFIFTGCTFTNQLVESAIIQTNMLNLTGLLVKSNTFELF